MKDYLKEVLNSQQFEAAKHIEWASLILAWAWAGKTRTLTYKIAYMSYMWISPSNILAVTFTNKAAAEMKERLSELTEEISKIQDERWKMKKDNDSSEVSTRSDWDFSTTVEMTDNKDDEVDFDSLISEEEEIQDADIDDYLQEYDNETWSKKAQENINYNWIWTFHSIFLRILKQDIQELNNIFNTKYDRNFNISDEGDALRIIRWILKDLWIKDTFTPKEIKWKISALKNKWLTAKEAEYQSYDDNDEIIAKVYKRYEKSMREQNTLDFDDLLLLPYLLFKNNQESLKKWQNKFKYILVDEAQDTNKIQFELIHMLSTSYGNITLIWDDFQSIYGWRWAVIDEFLNAKKHWPDLQIFKLETNYRSKKTIVDAWSAIIANNKNQYEKNIQSFTEKESKIKIISFPSDADEAIQVVELLKKLNAKWKKWSDFALIYRTNAQSEPFEKVLLTEAIPYKVQGAFKFYERKEVKDILSYIKYIINSQDGLSLSRIINTPWRKIWQTTINKLLEQASLEGVSLHNMINNIEHTPVNAWAKNNIQWFNELINYIKQQIKNKKPSESIETIVKAIKYEEYLEKEYSKEDARERMANIWQLMNVAINFSTKWEEWLRQFIDEVSLFVDLEDKNQEEVDQVQLMTVHSSKWLEFDTVFLTGLEENVFPLSRARLDPKQLEEERRLMYVGITRAKNNLFLTYAESRKQYWNLKYNPVSRFVDEIPQELTTSFNSKSSSSSNENNLQIHDKVKHKLFGVWEVMEVFQDKVIVRFYWSWIRQILSRMLEKIN